MTSAALSESQLRRLLDAGRTLVSELDLEAVLNRLLETARELTEARYAALGILDEDKRELERFLYLGVDEETRRRIGPLPQGKGVLGELIRNPQPLRLPKVGDHVRSYGFPPGHPPMDTFVGVPIQIRGELFGNIYLTEKSEGREFDEADEALLVVLADWAAVAIHNARVHERSEKGRVKQARAVQALEATASLSRVGAAEGGADWVLETIVKRGRALLESRVMLALGSNGDSELIVRSAAGERSGELPGRRILADDALLADARDDAVQHLHRGRTYLFDELGTDADSALLAHMGPPGESQGFLLALDALGREDFSPEDAIALDSFAQSAATSLTAAVDVERDRLRRSIEAAEQERRRWAMELHDETLQDLGALKVITEGALASDDPERLRHALAGGTEQLEHTIAGLESLISELRPASLDQLGPGAAIDALVSRVTGLADVDAVTDIDLAYERGDESTRHTPSLEATLYRLVQEALNNAVKHSGCSRVKIAVTEAGDSVDVAVEDDGCGFDPGAAGEGRFGLHGMRERVELAGGALTIDSAPGGEGTRVRARLPVERRAAEDSP